MICLEGIVCLQRGNRGLCLWVVGDRRRRIPQGQELVNRGGVPSIHSQIGWLVENEIIGTFIHLRVEGWVRVKAEGGGGGADGVEG